MRFNSPASSINPSQHHQITDALAELYIYQDFYRAPFTEQNQFRAWCTSISNPYRKKVEHYSNHLLHALYGSMREWQDALGQDSETFSRLKLKKILIRRPALVDNIIKKGVFFQKRIHDAHCIHSIIEQWYADHPQFAQACKARKVRTGDTAPLKPFITSYAKYLRLYSLSPKHYKKPLLAAASDLHDWIEVFSHSAFGTSNAKPLAKLAGFQKGLEMVLDSPEIMSLTITPERLEKLKQLCHDIVHHGTFNLQEAYSSHAVISQTCRHFSKALNLNDINQSRLYRASGTLSRKNLSLNALYQNLVAIIRKPGLIQTAELYASGQMLCQEQVFNLYALSRVAHLQEISTRIDELYPDVLYKIKSDFLNLFSSQMCGNTAKHLLKVAVNTSGALSIEDSHLNEKAFIDTGYYEVMDSDVESQLVRLAKEGKPSIVHLSMSLFEHDLIIIGNERGQAMILQSNTSRCIEPQFNLMQWLEKEPQIFNLEDFANDLVRLNQVLQSDDREAALRSVKFFAKRYLQVFPTDHFDYSKAHALTLRRFAVEFRVQDFCHELERLQKNAVRWTVEHKNALQPHLPPLKRHILKKARAQFYDASKELALSVKAFKEAYALLPEAQQLHNQDAYSKTLTAASKLECKLNRLIAVARAKTDSFTHLEKDLDSVVGEMAVIQEKTKSLIQGTGLWQTQDVQDAYETIRACTVS